MDTDPGAEDEGPFFAWLPPEDRLWRHPSETPPAQPAAGQFTSSPAPSAGPSDGRRRGRLAFFETVGGRTATMAVIAGLVGALAASGIGLAAGWWNQKTTVVKAVIPTTPAVSLAAAGGNSVNWTAVDDSVAPTVVSVNVAGASGPQIGSGLLLYRGGGGNAFVVTDRALLAPGQSAAYLGAIHVTFPSGTTTKGKLVGQDSLSGLAIIEVPDLLKAYPNIGTVADLRDADQVLAVGARAVPGGSVFTGSVSGQDQEVSVPNGSDLDNLISVSIPSMTASAIGGPLLDQFGRVVAVTVDPGAADTTEQGPTFAVPIDEVTRVASQIINGTPVTHAWLGITGAEDLPSLMAHQYGLMGGVQAEGVESNSPAARLGMSAHDVITEFDGKPVTSTGAMISILDSCDPGHFAPITYIHGNKTITTTVRLGNEPDS